MGKSGAGDEARTRTGVTTHGILSPRRLPIPPLRHATETISREHTLTVMFEQAVNHSVSGPPCLLPSQARRGNGGGNLISPWRAATKVITECFLLESGVNGVGR